MADLSQVEFNDITYNLKDSEARENISALNQVTTYEQKTGSIVSFEASAANIPLKELIVNIEPVQEGSGDPSPDNIRPISGWTGAKIEQTGKNLLPPRSYGDGLVSGIDVTTLDGGNGVHLEGTATGNPTQVNYCLYELPAGTYAVFGFISEFPNDVTIRIGKQTIGGTLIKKVSATDNTFSLTEPTKIGVRILINQNAILNHNMYPMICLATETDDMFVPYTNNQISITFPSEVFRGTLDVLSGKLTVTYKKIVIDQNSSLGKSGSNFYFKVSDMVKKANYVGSVFCDRLPTAEKSGTMDLNQISGYYDSSGTYPNDNWIYWSISGVTTQANMKTWLTNNPLTVVYELATPIIYDLADIPEITTLLGTNHIWANTGNVTVSYGAYLETIQTHADQLGNSILSAIAPLETTYTASRSYAIGSYLFVGTKFYKVTAAIAKGGTITPDTNVTQTTVAEQLMALAAN